MMTNKQHDDLWIGAFSQIPGLADSIRRANALVIMKELYELGELTKEDYTKSLLSIAKSEGFRFSNI